MELRFSCFLDVTASKFSPLAAAACFVDPSISTETLVENEDEEINNLLKKAEDYIVNSVPPRLQATDDEEEEENTKTSKATHLPVAKRPRFRFFSTTHPFRPKTSYIRQEIQKYKEGLSHAAADNAEESAVES